MWKPFDLLEPGTIFEFNGSRFLKIIHQTLINKTPVNAVALSNGVLVHFNATTAVEVP